VKATLLAALALALGIGMGVFMTNREFAKDVLPLDLTPTSGSAAASKTKIGPKVVVVNNERHEFGKMDRTEHRSHVYVIRNDGDAPLTLETGQPSCGVCVKVFKVDRSEVPPGERANVTIEWEAKPGDIEFEQSGPLTTNDPRRPTIQLTIKGTIIDTVRAERTDVHFHDISANEPAAGGINIHSFRFDDPKVENFELTNSTLAPFFNVSFVPLASSELAKEPNAKAGLKMNIEIKPGMPIGRIEQSVKVTTNQPGAPPLTVNIHGNVISDIYLAAGQMVAPEKLLVGLGPVQRSEGAKRTFYLIVKGPHRDATQLQVASVTPPMDFKATLGEPNRDNPKIIRYPLNVEVPAGATPVNHMSEGAYAQVRLTSTHPDVKELNIKVRYAVTE
jgi:hypothetical protein